MTLDVDLHWSPHSENNYPYANPEANALSWEVRERTLLPLKLKDFQVFFDVPWKQQIFHQLNPHQPLPLNTPLKQRNDDRYRHGSHALSTPAKQLQYSIYNQHLHLVWTIYCTYRRNCLLFKQLCHKQRKVKCRLHATIATTQMLEKVISRFIVVTTYPKLRRFWSACDKQ